MLLETHVKLGMTAWFFGKACFAIGENDQKKTENKAFLIKKNLVINFHWICSKMKIFVICCVPTQILYLEKSCILFLRYRPKYSQSDRPIWDFLNKLFLQSKLMKQFYF